MRTDSPQEFERFFNIRGERLELCGMYRGMSAFLLCNGPSFSTLDHGLLKAPGIVTMGINNGVATFRPNLWICVDEPYRFLPSIWLDPNIQKFVPLSIAHQAALFKRGDSGKTLAKPVLGCPNVVCYKRGNSMSNFLNSPWFSWGEPTKVGGAKSVMLPALKTLYLLGFSKIYLLGADFVMSESYGYHFDQSRSPNAVKGNNHTYEKLKEWLPSIGKAMEASGCKIFNCNRDSALTAFEYQDFETSVREASKELSGYLDSEVVTGRYEALASENRKGRSLPEICCDLNCGPITGIKGEAYGND